MVSGVQSSKKKPNKTTLIKTGINLHLLEFQQSGWPTEKAKPPYIPEGIEVLELPSFELNRMYEIYSSLQLQIIASGGIYASSLTVE